MDMADERFRGNMHGLAKDAVVLSLDRAGTQARQSMLHASLAPPPQVRQRGRRIFLFFLCVSLLRGGFPFQGDHQIIIRISGANTNSKHKCTKRTRMTGEGH